jgi:hypothetical protein
MEKDEKVKEAQKILEWAIMHLKGSIKCKVTDYKHENYRVQVFTKDNKLIMPVQIAEEEINKSDPKENFVPDRLKTLLRNLENF